MKCCGPAQVGGKVFDQVKEWCESSTPYHSLSLGKKSPVVDTQALETVFFRFFVPEEAYCQPFQIFIRPFYGAPTFSLSNLYAFPDQQTGSWFKGSLPPISFRFIQNSFVVCPSLHADYSLGTYSLAVTSFYSASFYVEILLSPQNYPLQPPPRRISCDDVPEEEKNGRTCLQDTESFEILVPNRNPNYDFVLPVPSGRFFPINSILFSDFLIFIENLFPNHFWGRGKNRVSPSFLCWEWRNFGSKYMGLLHSQRYFIQPYFCECIFGKSDQRRQSSFLPNMLYFYFICPLCSQRLFSIS